MPSLDPLPSLMLNKKQSKFILLLGLGGLGLWFLTTSFKNDALSLTVKQDKALSIAQNALIQKGITPSQWYPLITVTAPLNDNDQFVWQKGGKQIYHHLLSNLYLTPPHWQIRFVKFNGNADERSESIEVLVAEHGSVIRTTHKKPESFAGASLTEQEARKKTHQILREEFKVDPAKLIEISATPKKLPARIDWTFIYSHPEDYPLQTGQARLTLHLSGNEVVSAYRSVHVPEEWQRAHRNTQSMLKTLQAIFISMLVILFIAAVLYILLTFQFSWSQALIFFVILFLLNIIQMISGWPTLIAFFNTSEPWNNQIFKLLAATFIGNLLLNAGMALALSFISHQQWSFKKHFDHILTALGLGTLLAGLLAFTKRMIPSVQPLWAKYATTGFYFPIISGALQLLLAYITITLVILLIFIGMNRLTNNGRRHHTLLIACFISLGLAASGLLDPQSILLWCIYGFTLGIFLAVTYYHFFRFNPALILFTSSILFALDAVQYMGLNAYPAAIPGNALGIILIGFASKYLYNLIIHPE